VRLVLPFARATAFVSVLVGGFLGTPRSTCAQSTVQVGDRIVFRMWLAEPVRDTLDVNESGRVVFHSIGPLRVVGWPTASIGDSVQRRMAVFFENIPVDVTVLKPVTVVGSVREANVFYVNSTATIRDAIAMAKGLDDQGDRKKVSLVRGGQATLMPDWDRPTGSPLALQSGDAIIVGRQSWFLLNGVQLGSLGLGVLSIVISLTK
jgi:protein involved in polysaccharide export with SLBB domain